MKRKHGLKLAIIFFIAFLVYVAFNGLLINWTSYLDGADEVRLGIDLKGGMYAYMQPEEGVTATREELDTAKGIIETRLDGSGIYDRTIMPDYTNNRIIVELPWQKGETSFNPEKIVDEIGQIAQLTFRAVNEDERDNTAIFAFRTCTGMVRTLMMHMPQLILKPKMDNSIRFNKRNR